MENPEQYFITFSFEPGKKPKTMSSKSIFASTQFTKHLQNTFESTFRKKKKLNSKF